MRAPMAMASWVMEGTMDAIARQLGLDPLAVRRVNMLQPAELPYTMATGEVLEDVTPSETLEAVAAAIDYEDFRNRQDEARAQNRYLGLGLCTVVEPTTYGSRFYKAAGIAGSGHEAAWVRIEPTGAVRASVGLMATGQGYESSLPLAVAEGLGVDAANVRPGSRQYRCRALRHGQPRRARRHGGRRRALSLRAQGAGEGAGASPRIC